MWELHVMVILIIKNAIIKRVEKLRQPNLKHITLNIPTIDPLASAPPAENHVIDSINNKQSSYQDILTHQLN